MIRLFVIAAVLVGALVAPAPAAAAATPWDVGVLIYRSIDADCNGRRVTGTLERVEIDPAAMAERFAVTIDAWSGVDHRTTIYEMGTLTSVTDAGSYCWPTAADVSLPGGHDSYIVVYDSDGTDPAAGVNPYYGLAFVGVTSGGYTWSTAMMPDGDEWWFPHDAYPELVMVHEWLHGVAGFYATVWGAQIPGVHDEGAYGYTDGVAWHRDLTGGRLPDLNGDGMPDGLTMAVWESGTPSTGLTAPTTPDKPCRNARSSARACR